MVNTGATSAATYTISDITSVAKAASETSKIGYADSSATPISTTGVVKLVVGAKSYDITLTPGTNNLVGLRNAINNLGVGATASVITTGTGLNPNYLSISANSSGAAALQLFDDPDGATKILNDTRACFKNSVRRCAVSIQPERLGQHSPGQRPGFDG